MTSPIQDTFHGEARTFFALAILNIVFAALTLAFGISTVVTQASAMLEAGDVQVASSVYLLFGCGAAIVGLWWLPKSAGILSDVDDIRDEAEGLADQDTEEETLRLMIRMMALYRDRRETVMRMVLVSRIGGTLFLFSSAVGLIGLILQVSATDGAVEPFTIYTGIVGIAVSSGMGAAALVISHFFGKYSAAWEARLADKTRVDAMLNQTLEKE